MHELKRTLIATAWIGVCLGWVGGATQSQAQTAPPIPYYSSQLLPTDREEIADDERISWTLKKFPPQPYMSELYWQLPPETPAFFRDSLLQYVVRTYYLTRDNFNDTKSQAWTGGGWIAFRSGLIADAVGVHAAYYTSLPIVAPGDEGGSRLLNPDQNSLGMLGQLYGRVQVFDQEFRGGKQLVDTPLINPSDNRMVPNTFLGTTLVTLPDKDRNYEYALGYLWTVKQRDSNDFIPMSQALAGADVGSVGATFGMLRYRPFSGLSTVIMDYYIQNFINTGFAQVEYNFQLPKEVPNWIVGANIIDQRSVGDNLFTGIEFQTYQASAKAQTTYAGWTLFVAGSSTGGASSITSPFGTKPNYTDMQQVSFDNANEKAFGGSVAYDFGYAFGNYGLSGLSLGAWYTQGWDAIDPDTNLGIPNRRELDLWIQYRPTEGPLKGFRLKTQYSDLWQQGNARTVQPEFRFIIDYTILVRPPPT